MYTAIASPFFKIPRKKTVFEPETISEKYIFLHSIDKLLESLRVVFIVCYFLYFYCLFLLIFTLSIIVSFYVRLVILIKATMKLTSSQIICL